MQIHHFWKALPAINSFPLIIINNITYHESSDYFGKEIEFYLSACVEN